MRKIIYLFISLIITQVVHSQTNFISAGKIHYNAKFYLQSYWPQIEASNRMPFIISDNVKMIDFSYNLLFDTTQSSFIYDAANSPSAKYIDNYFSDFRWLRMNYYRKFGDSIYYKTINDIFYKALLPKITWKLTSESRQIAGLDCQRANGLINDSIYAVAYFSEKILPSVAPFGLQDLPGAILGLAIPDIHISFFADKIEENKPKIEHPELEHASNFILQHFRIFPNARQMEQL